MKKIARSEVLGMKKIRGLVVHSIPTITVKLELA